MSRKYVLSLLGLFLCVSLNAQIQRKFLGFTLGSSTKSAVINGLKAKGFKPVTDDNETYSVRYIKFAGHTWPYAAFTFYKGILHTVNFSDSDGLTPRQTIDVIWETLDTNLSEKYGKYYDSEFSSSVKKEFADGRTRIVFNYDFFQGSKIMSLMYYDINIRAKMSDDSADEL